MSKTIPETIAARSAYAPADAPNPGDVTSVQSSACGSPAQACCRTCEGRALARCGQGTFPSAERAAPARKSLSCLQIGGEWFSEKSGGLERYYNDLLNHLPGASVTACGLVVGSASVATESGGSVRGVAAASESLFTRLRAMRREAGLLRNNGFDAVASHFALYAAPALSAYRDLPWVIHFHGPWAAEGRADGGSRSVAWFKRAVEKRVYRRGVRFITLSNAFARLLSERYGIDEEKISVVPGGVDVRQFRVTESQAEARAKLGWPADRRIAVSVRRLIPRMGLENLIDAAARPELRDALFMIAGRGPLAEQLQRRANEAGAGDRVRFLGYVSDEQLPLLYRAADLTVIPSVALEGFGLTTVESLMAGTPALVTPIGGLPEVVTGLSPSLITEDSGVDALAEGLQRFLFGGAALPTAEVCRRYAIAHFDWRVIAGKVRDVYEQAIAAA